MSGRAGPSRCASRGDWRAGGPPKVHGGTISALAIFAGRDGDAEAARAGHCLALVLGSQRACVLRQLRQVLEVDGGAHGFCRLDWQIV